MATNQSVSGIRVFIVVAACMAATYFLIGASDYGMALQSMLAVVLLLALPAKINRGTARVIAVVLTVAGIGSTMMVNSGMATQALALRALTFIVFVFTTLTAIGFLLKILLGVVGMVALVGLIGYVMSAQEAQNQGSGGNTQVDFGPQEDRQSEERPQDILRAHLRNWEDYEARKLQGNLEVWANDYKSSTKNRLGLQVSTQNVSEYWGQVYSSLVNHDSRHLERVIDMFATIGREQKLSQLQLANAIVACVQQIPYVLIYTGDCSKIPEENPQLVEIIKQSPCKGGVQYGLQAPTEFIYDLQGDCDTRTVLLFTILGKLGYKVCVMNSEQYGHSMLGIELPATGAYKPFKGARYYFWETTAANWGLGMLPPEMGQVQYWDVMLSN